MSENEEDEMEEKDVYNFFLKGVSTVIFSQNVHKSNKT